MEKKRWYVTENAGGMDLIMFLKTKKTALRSKPYCRSVLLLVKSKVFKYEVRSLNEAVLVDIKQQ